jgi:ribosome recycling factor
MLEDIKKDANERMNKCVAAFKNELKKLRTGRAHTSLLEHIRVEYYGNEVPINQVANLAVEDARTLTVTPWEKTMVQAIEKAIMKSDLGIQPVNDGKVIRLTLPTPTEERRKQLVKSVHKMAEEARVAVRNVRRDGMDQLKKAKAAGMAEDEQKLYSDEIQQLTDAAIAKIDAALATKQEEIMQI